MIPAQNIVAWGNLVPWTDVRQIEQDLIISRALVEIFSDPMLREALRFRGGTALNKLHFAALLRYSEDIDFVRTAHGPIGPDSMVKVRCRSGLLRPGLPARRWSPQLHPSRVPRQDQMPTEPSGSAYHVSARTHGVARGKPVW